MGSALVANVTGSFNRVGDRLVSSVKTAAKVAGTAGAALLGTSLWGGLKRTLDTEDARKLFGQLGLGVSDIDSLMGDLNQKFLTGPFAYPDVYDVSSQLLASGIGMDKLVDTTAAVGNMAAFAGEDLSRLGEVTSVIGANGRVMASELNRLGQMGIPIRQILAEALDVTGEELSGMVSAGKLTSEVFFDLIGDAEQFSGAMDSFGSTTRGAWSIMKAGIAGVGEALLSPWFGEDGDMARFLGRINDLIFDRVQPAVTAFGESLRAQLIPAVQRASAFFTGTLLPALRAAADWFTDNRDTIVRIGSALGPAVAAFGALAATVTVVSRVLALTPVGAVLALATALVYAWQNSERFRAVVTGAFEGVRAVISPVVDAVSGLVARFQGGDGLDGAMDRVRSAIDRVVGAFREGGVVFEWVSNLWASLRPRFDAIGEAFTTIGNTLGPVVSWVGERLPGAFRALWSVAQPILGFLVTVIGDTLRLAVNGIVQAFQGAVQIISGVLDVFAGLFTGDWSRMWEGVKSIATGIFNVIVGAVKTWLAVSVLKVFRAGLTAIRALWSRAWGAIRNGVTSAGRSIVSTVRGWTDTVRLRVWEVMERVRAFIGRSWETIRGIFTRAGEAIRTTVANALTRIRTAVTQGITRVVGYFRELPRRIVRALGNLGRTLYSSGRDLIRGLWEGIKGMGSWLTGRLTSWVEDRIPGPIARALGISSPSKVAMKLGKNFGEGLGLGIEAELPMLERMAERSAEAMLPDLDAPAIRLRDAGGRVSRIAAQAARDRAATGAAAPLVGELALGSRDDLEEVEFALEKIAIQHGRWRRR